MSAGFIYVMSNDSMPGLLKIGGTERHPEQRARELSGTGVPTPFVVEFALFVKDWKLCESYVHDCLSEKRESKRREFFRISLNEAVFSVVRESAFDFGFDPVERCRVVEEPALDWIAHCLNVPVQAIARAVEYVPMNAWSFALKSHKQYVENRNKASKERASG